MFYNVAFTLVGLMTLISAALIIVGPKMCDRLLGLNLMASKITLLIIMYAMLSGQTFYLDIGLVFSTLGFIGIIFIGNFIKNRGKI